MISAFGERAERFARGLGALNAVIAEPHTVTTAYIDALARRERGESFYAMILLDDPRVSVAYSSAIGILTQVADPDRRMDTFSDLAAGTVVIDGKSAAEHWNGLVLEKAVWFEFYLLANAMLVRSFAEYAFLMELMGQVSRPVHRVLVEPALPAFSRRLPDRPTVVIWGPRRPARELALHLGGMSGFPGELICVSADTGARYAGVRVLHPTDPELPEILARTACVVCIEPNDPGDAVAFARHGIGIVAPLTSGANEFVPEAVIWDAAHAVRLYQAVSSALARPTHTRVTTLALPASPPAPPSPVPIDELPLVSIIIPTYNRPGDLRSALRAVAAQTYPRIEAIVVNDCGQPVEDVVGDFPFARLINHAENRGAANAQRTGLDAARGRYIEFLPDDDSIYPDHVERVTYALLRSGSKIAHGSGMLRYVKRRADGTWRTVGLNGYLLNDTLTPLGALVATPVSWNSVIHDRSVFEEPGEAGYWLIESPLNDLELHMRQGTRYVFVHVESITFEFREHDRNAAKLHDFPTELRRLYDVVHPTPEHPTLNIMRENTIAVMKRRVPGQPAFKPTLTLEYPGEEAVSDTGVESSAS